MAPRKTTEEENATEEPVSFPVPPAEDGGANGAGYEDAEPPWRHHSLDAERASYAHYGGAGGYPGTPAQPAWHRPPPIVANVPQDAVQFDVQRLENGRPQDVGDIAKQATVYDLVERFGKPGTYWLTPKDMQGNPLTAQPYVIDISPDHVAFKMGAAGMAPGVDGVPPGMGGFGAVPVQLWGLLAQQEEKAAAREERLLARLAKAEEAAIAERTRTNEVQVALAVDNTASALETQRTLMAEHRQSQQQGMSQVVQMMTMAQQQAEAAHNAALERQAARAAEDERRHEQRMAQMRAEEDARRQRDKDDRAAEREREREMREIERARDEARYKADREEADRRERERIADAEARRQQNQEHQKMMLATIKERGDANDPQTFLTQLGGMIAMAKDIGLDKMISGGGPQGMGELVASTLQTGMNALVEMKKAEALIAEDADPEDEDPMLAVRMPDGNVVQMRQSQLLALQAQQNAGQLPGPPGQPPGPPGPPQGHPGQPPQPQGAYQGAYQGDEVITPETAPQDPRAEAVNQLPIEVRKGARMGLRELVSQLAQQPDREQWNAMIIQGIQANPAIFHYIRLRAIRPSLIEAGATENLASAILHVIEQSGQVPQDIPRI
jgi:hypothetical protein